MLVGGGGQDSVFATWRRTKCVSRNPTGRAPNGEGISIWEEERVGALNYSETLCIIVEWPSNAYGVANKATTSLRSSAPQKIRRYKGPALVEDRDTDEVE